MTDWMPELGDDDLDVLMDALEAWESKDLSGEIMGSVLDSMLTRREPMPPEVMMQRQLDKDQKERDKRTRKERSVMLRAKLLTIRDRRRAERMVEGALHNP